MKHINLIELICKNRELIDKAYKEEIFTIDRELEESTLFIRIGSSYRLNRNYIHFVDSILQRVDYNIIFGDYEKEYKELIKNRDRFLESGKKYYKDSILRLIEDLYSKFLNRDREIQALLLKLENDKSLEIDILIEKSYDILDKINEFIDANRKIGYSFGSELRSIDSDIDGLLQEISIDILKFIENIDEYIKRLKQFILQTKQKRQQNRKIIQLSNLILEEKVTTLDEYLSLNIDRCFHSVTRNQKNRIYAYPDDKNIRQISKELKKLLKNIDVKKPIKDRPLKKQKKDKLDLIDIDKIIRDLNHEKSSDVFYFIQSHSELKGYNGESLKDEAFKLFLQLSIEKNMIFNKEFNQYGVRIARWE